MKLLAASEEAGCELSQLCFICKHDRWKFQPGQSLKSTMIQATAMMPDNLPTIAQK